MSARKKRPAGSRMPRSIYAYVWQANGRHQIALSLLSATVFGLSLAPLELQRRIVNQAFRGNAFRDILVLCAAYAVVALLMGVVKFGVNVYRGFLAEVATRDLRHRVHALAANISSDKGSAHA